MRIRKTRKGRPRPKSLLPNPAPGRLRLVQEFVNTRDDDSQRDELNTPEAFRAWLAHRQLIPADTPFDETIWRSGLEVRDGLRALIRANGDLALDGEAIDRLNRAIHASPPIATFGPEGELVLENTQKGWAGALAQLLAAISQAMVEGHWKRLKACRNANCEWAYYDASKNSSGKWCNGRRCGNRIHARTYRRRGPGFTRIG